MIKSSHKGIWMEHYDIERLILLWCQFQNDLIVKRCCHIHSFTHAFIHSIKARAFVKRLLLLPVANTVAHNQSAYTGTNSVFSSTLSLPWVMKSSAPFSRHPLLRPVSCSKSWNLWATGPLMLSQQSHWSCGWLSSVKNDLISSLKSRPGRP